MLTSTSIELLLALDLIITSNGFHIIERVDIINAVPVPLPVQDMDLSMRELQLEGLIKIKYSDDSEYCISFTDIARHRAEEIRALRSSNSNAKVVRVQKDMDGNTVVEYNDEQPNAQVPSTVVRKGLRPHPRFSSFLYGALGGIITSIAAILTFVYAF